MGLYRDAGGVPGARVAHSGAMSFAGGEASGSASMDSEPCLVSGKFWIVAVATAQLMLEEAGDSVPSVLLQANNGTDLPSPWPGGGNKSGSTLSLYVEVDRP
jgi:hypothetical protein